jgi:hypothetical protein
MSRRRRRERDPIADACAALGRGEWAAARDAFVAAGARADAADRAEACEGLGLAHWWLADGAAAIAAREQAYRLYAARGDALGAARVATWLSGDHRAAGARALADEWGSTAHRLLEALPPAQEHGWLAHRDGEVAREDGNYAAARACGAQAAEVGRVLAIDGLETAGQALEGLALVMLGDVEAAAAHLDRAAADAYSGEMSDRQALEATTRHLGQACAALRDAARPHPRAAASLAQWRAGASMAPRRGPRARD